MSKIYWIITDDVRIAQKFIRKNHLPRMLSESEFEVLLTKEVGAKDPDEADDVYYLKRALIFSEKLRGYLTEVNRDVTVVSTIDKSMLGHGKSFYRPNNYPEVFAFLTTTALTMFKDGSRNIIRHHRQYRTWTEMVKDLRGDVPKDYGRMVSKELKLAYDRNKPKRRLLRNLLRFHGYPLKEGIPAVVFSRGTQGEPSTLKLLTNLHPKGFEKIDGKHYLQIGFTRDLIS